MGLAESAARRNYGHCKNTYRDHLYYTGQPGPRQAPPSIACPSDRMRKFKDRSRPAGERSNPTRSVLRPGACFPSPPPPRRDAGPLFTIPSRSHKHRRPRREFTGVGGGATPGLLPCSLPCGLWIGYEPCRQDPAGQLLSDATEPVPTFTEFGKGL